MANTWCNRAIQLIGVLRTPGWGSSSVARWLATLRRATMLARVHWPLSHILVLRGTGTSVCIGRQ